MTYTTLLAGSALAFATAIGGGFLQAQADDRLRLECEAEGAGDISMKARYEERDRQRRKFSTEFEAAPGGTFEANQEMTVIVRGIEVGSVVLKTARDGDLVGDLNLDSARGTFPANFPKIKAKSKVQLLIEDELVLGCRLAVD